MIPFASQRGGGQDLATHLMNAYDNEVAELAHLRGAIASDLHGAFKEWQVQAEDLTRCEKYLYSLSINPDPRQGPLTRDQYMDYIARTEESLGLTNQPRAIVFHEKYGREHCHVVWSRIDAAHAKAVHLAFDHEKLMRVTRAFARDHGLRLPPGYEKSREKGQESLYDREKKRQTGLSQEDHMRAVTQAWQQSDSSRAFVQALSANGYLLATGKRPYVLVDIYGGTHALARLIDDKTVKTADLRKFLAKDFPPESLPRVEEALALVERHRASLDKEASEEERATALSTLRNAQQARGLSLVQERLASEARQRLSMDVLVGQQRAARDALRRRYLAERLQITRQRIESRPTGLAAFLGRITGAELLRTLLHKRQDAQRLKAYAEQHLAMKVAQVRERMDQEQQHQAEASEHARREKALRRVERREVVAMLRDLHASQRILLRGGNDGRMPSLESVVRGGKSAQQGAPGFMPMLRPGETRDAFENAVIRGPSHPPNLLAAFSRAAQQRRECEKTDEKAPALDHQSRPVSDRTLSKPSLERGAEPGTERD